MCRDSFELQTSPLELVGLQQDRHLWTWSCDSLFCHLSLNVLGVTDDQLHFEMEDQAFLMKCFLQNVHLRNCVNTQTTC